MSTLAERLRAVAELLDAHPDLPTPCVFAYNGGRAEVTWQLMHDDSVKADQKAAAIAIRRAIGGTWAKQPWSDRFDFERKYGDLTLQILANRDQVCERVVTGVETVTVPATEAVEAQPERTEEREIVKWRCDPVLADDDVVEAVSA